VRRAPRNESENGQHFLVNGRENYTKLFWGEKIKKESHKICQVLEKKKRETRTMPTSNSLCRQSKFSVDFVGKGKLDDTANLFPWLIC